MVAPWEEPPYQTIAVAILSATYVGCLQLSNDSCIKGMDWRLDKSSRLFWGAEVCLPNLARNLIGVTETRLSSKLQFFVEHH